MIWTEKYKCLSILKKHEATTVYLAEHISLKQPRIIKQIPKCSSRWQELYSEAQLMKQFHHPGIPVVYDIEEEEDQFSIIEQYIPGESLFSYCLKQHLQMTEVLSFTIQLCNLVEYLHCREIPILHLDLKPENLKLYEGRIYLLDFGSAMPREDVKGKKVLTGTPGYCAPECYHGEATEQSDLYSMGKILEFMLEHAVSEKGLTRRNRRYRENEQLRRRLYRIAAKGTKENTAYRYASVREMRHALAACFSGKTSAAYPATIAVAGCGRRCGTTYVSLLLAGYLRRQGRKVLYLECNESNQVIRLLPEKKQGSTEGSYHGVMLAESSYCYYIADANGTGWKKEERELQRQGYSVIIRDYGSLTRENAEYFRQAEGRLLVGGCNDWELEELWYGLQLLSEKEQRQVKLLLNFGSEMSAATVRHAVHGMSCYRLPVSQAVPDKLPDEWLGVFQEIFPGEPDATGADL